MLAYFEATRCCLEFPVDLPWVPEGYPDDRQSLQLRRKTQVICK